MRSCSNVEMDVLSNSLPEPKAINDLSFQLKDDATHTPSLIVVQLDDVYLVNELKLEGYPGVPKWMREEEDEEQPFCYSVQVAKDSSEWITVVDHSNLRCYSTQQLYFQKQAVRYSHELALQL